MVSIHNEKEFELELRKLIGKKLIDYKFDEQKYFWDLILIFEDGFTLKLGGYDYELLLEKEDQFSEVEQIVQELKQNPKFREHVINCLAEAIRKEIEKGNLKSTLWFAALVGISPSIPFLKRTSRRMKVHEEITYEQLEVLFSWLTKL